MTLDELEVYLPSIKCEVKAAIGDEITLELNSDRPDMLSVEGVVRALRSYMEMKTGPQKIMAKKGPVNVKALASTEKVRPFIACSVLRGIKLSDEIVRQMMQLQEKLHETYCRNRRKASIGIYDLDKVSPNIIYEAASPDKISFVPLEANEKMSGTEILERTDKGIKYAPIIKQLRVYPLLRDENGIVLSMPPILNSEDTRVTSFTEDLFIDVTGLDERLVNSVNNILIYNLTLRGGNPEIVSIKYSTGRKIATPFLKPTEMIMNIDYANQTLGLSLGAGNMTRLLRRAGHNAKPINGHEIRVLIPPYRCDILHQIDLVEDVAMSYGFNNLTPELPSTATVGKELAISTLTRTAREIMIGFAFQEVLNYILSNKNILCTKMRREADNLIEISNPMSMEYHMLRDSLIPGLLNYLSFNRHVQYPQKIFECGDVIGYARKSSPRTLRKLAAVICNYKASFEDVQSIAYTTFKTLNLKQWSIEGSHHPSFIDGRSAQIRTENTEIAILGEIHPEVLKNFKLENPVVTLEINMTELLTQSEE
jgi:phenylalanyl-tRNA synthetase beta chain